MNLKEARKLRVDDIVLDSDGKPWPFLGLDQDNDLFVRCRPAMGGRIVLFRERCTVAPKSTS